MLKLDEYSREQRGVLILSIDSVYRALSLSLSLCLYAHYVLLHPC